MNGKRVILSCVQYRKHFLRIWLLLFESAFRVDSNFFLWLQMFTCVSVDLFIHLLIFIDGIMLFYWTADGRFELYYTQLIVIYGWNLHSTRRADDDFFRFRNNYENAPQSRIRANTHTGCHLYFHWEKMQRARIKCKNNVFFEVIFFLLRLFYYLRFKYDSVHNLLRQGFDLMTWSSSFDKKTNYSLLFGRKCLFSSNFCIEVICISIAVPCSL